MAGEYAELIRGLGLELETMSKALKTDDSEKKADCDGDDDKKIVAAAKDGEAKSEADDKDGEKMGKSFQMTMEDGSTVEAFDGTQAIAELVTQNGELRAAVEDLQKAFSAAVDVLKQVRSDQAEHGTLIKAFGQKVSTAVSSPSGRRSMMTIVERLSPAEAGQQKTDAPNPQRLMAKARDLCKSGQMAWDQMSRIEAYQGRGMIAPPDLLAHFPDLAS